MSTHKHIDKICAVAVVLSLVLCIAFMNAGALGIQPAGKAMGYETRLFDTERVHTIDIVMDDWDSFIASAQSEEYSVCTVVIDGESYSNVGIRGKGNTSLSSVSSMNSDRYSFKIEFDQYDSTKSYYGLDKLSLNNVIQDATYMKDYLTYRMMAEFGAAAPLCSYAYITVNGEDWGLYLAVEAIEDSFLQRNYGSDYGELYKPDSMDFGGGRGNGMNFDMDEFMNSENETETTQTPERFGIPDQERQFSGNDGFSFSLDEETVRAALEEQGIDASVLDGIDLNSLDMDTVMELMNSLPSNIDWEELARSVTGPSVGGADWGSFDGGRGGFDMGGGMGSSDVKLQYIDDNADSYSNIFGNAKTEITEADQARLVESLAALTDGENIENVVDIDAAMRYFVVHNFVVNGDSYTGGMVHNYYLYEENGVLSMIPWDYNLAYGTFQGGDSTASVNDPIDTPLSVGSGDRPMIDWIFASKEYTELYHQYFAQFISDVDITGIIDEASQLIAPYVEKDHTAFYSYEEFEAGVSTLREFCALRVQSVSAQLAGNIPTTDDGQAQNSSGLVDASHISLSDMGSMGGGFGGDRGSFGGEGTTTQMPGASGMEQPGGMQQPGGMPQDGQAGMQPPNGFGGQQNAQNGEMSQMPEGMDIPGDWGMSDAFGAQIPSGTGEEITGREPNSSFEDAASFSQSENNIILIAVCVVVLLAGLFAAFKFKR